MNFQRFHHKNRYFLPTLQQIQSGIALAITLGSLTILEPQPAEAELNLDSPTNDISQPFLKVSNLRDITPKDWSYQALNRLVNRNLCPEGTPPQDFFRQPVVSRWDFASVLNDCLSSLKPSLDLETFGVIQNLQSDFTFELEQLHQKLHSTEQEITQLRSQQFSPTTQLEGEAIMAFTGVMGDRADDSSDPINANVTLSNRLRLDLKTSFSRRDLLTIRLQARNISELETVTETQMVNLSFDGADENRLELVDLNYQFSIGQETEVFIGATGAGLGDFIPTINPYFGSSGRGAISTFGRENPLTRQGGGAGFGLNHDLTPWANLGVGYVVNNADDPQRGLLGDRYGAIAQLTLMPTKTASIGLTYVRSFNNFDTGTGSRLASDPFDDEAESVDANSWSAEASIDLTPRMNIGGRFGLIQATASDLDNIPTADIVTWAMYIALSDLGRENSQLGIVFGQPPKVTRNQYDRKLQNLNTSLHLETFYRFQATDNIDITPGVIVLFNPEHSTVNGPIYVGTVRTTFRF